MPFVPTSETPFYDEIRIYTARLTGNWAWADDLVQETYLRFLQAKDDIQPGAQRAWLYRTARNLFIDQFRRQKRTKKIENVVKSDLIPDRVAQQAAGTNKDLEQAEAFEQILSVVDRLPERQQEVIRLKFQQGLSYEEISQITGDTKTTIGWLLHEAVTRLRKELTQ